MHNGKWLGSLFLAFLAGYFAHLFSIDNNAEATSDPHESFTSSSTPPSNPALVHTPTKNYWVAASSVQHSTQTSSQSSTHLAVRSAASSNKTSIAVSDQTAEKTLPKPFDDLFTQMDEPLRDKYKAYADNETNHKDDWDLRMQSQITDFILSRPAATDIKIELVNCNLNMCEIRLQEQKRFLLMATFAELLQEPWIINTSTGQFNFSDNNGYMLLMRK